MALQTSGPISVGDLASEFGGGVPHSLSEYYGAASGVPASGAIALSAFYGASSSFALTITSDQENLDLRSYALSQGWDGASAASITIASGVVIYSAIGYALTISGTFPGGLTLTNHGHIVGGGGNGADGAYRNPQNLGLPRFLGAAPPTNGQPAIDVQSAVSIDNKGVIAGGGGGGAGGGASTERGGGGGGGRSGLVNAAGGLRGGADGTFAAPGFGGPFLYISGRSWAGQGGTGGAWGANGAIGSSPLGRIGFTTTYPPAYTVQPVGGGGAAVVGNSNITWIATGERYGAIQ